MIHHPTDVIPQSLSKMPCMCRWQPTNPCMHATHGYHHITTFRINLVPLISLKKRCCTTVLLIGVGAVQTNVYCTVTSCMYCLHLITFKAERSSGEEGRAVRWYLEMDILQEESGARVKRGYPTDGNGLARRKRREDCRRDGGGRGEL